MTGAEHPEVQPILAGPEKPVEVAIAILYQDGRFLMQLRDNTPGILYPGYWGFFGGHLEPGEDPDAGVRRELQEEIGYCPPMLHKFSQSADERVIRHVYHAPLTVSLESLTLTEGWDLGLVSPEEIHRGECYSAIAKQIRPLGPPHRQMLLEFLASGLL